MKQVQPDLWETQVENPAPGLTTHAYLLTRQEDNVLFYNTGHLQEIEKMAELGGVAYQYLSHRDELGQTLNVIGNRFGAKLAGHANEEADFAPVRAPDIVFNRRETHLGIIEVIPTPGHSPGSTCYLVHSSHGKQYLFTGDTLYHTDSGWRAGVIPGLTSADEQETLADSLQILRQLQPDVVFSSAFAGETGFQEMAEGDWAKAVDAALEKMGR